VTANAPAVVAEVVRSGFVEGHHRGSVVALAPDGQVEWAVGDVESQVFARSSNKPLQAVGMLRCGLVLEPRLLALVCASHSGEPFHVDGVRKILADSGLDEEALQTPPDYPLDDEARLAVIRSGGEPASVTMNCSGKHAGMLAACVINRWSTEHYREPDHPVQLAIRAAFESLTGEPSSAVGVDGCGAPLFAASLTSLAQAFRTLVTAAPETAEGRVAAAVATFPEFASGTRRDEAKLLRALPGAIGKAGAEASYAVALPDGRAFALKIDDGGHRARPVVMAAALRRSGVHHPVIDELGRYELLGGGRPVGEVRATI
jgi:L-asparaginase II